MNDKSSTLVDMTIRGDGRGSKSWRRGGGLEKKYKYCGGSLLRQLFTPSKIAAIEHGRYGEYVN